MLGIFQQTNTLTQARERKAATDTRTTLQQLEDVKAAFRDLYKQEPPADRDITLERQWVTLGFSPSQEALRQAGGPQIACVEYARSALKVAAERGGTSYFSLDQWRPQAYAAHTLAAEIDHGQSFGEYLSHPSYPAPGITNLELGFVMEGTSPQEQVVFIDRHGQTLDGDRLRTLFADMIRTTRTPANREALAHALARAEPMFESPQESFRCEQLREQILRDFRFDARGQRAVQALQDFLTG